MTDRHGEIWLGTHDFAGLVGIRKRAGIKALTRAAANKLWNGFELVVRTGAGRGGRSGIRYEVLLSSLSEELQRRYWEESATPAVAPIREVRRTAPNQTEEIGRRLPVVQAIIAHPRGSAERAAEIAAQAARLGAGFSVRTLNRWVRDCERSGGDIGTLARKLPSDAGQPRIHVSREFDKAFLAAGFPADRLPELGARAVQLIKAAWVARSGRGGPEIVKMEVATALARECREAGMIIPADDFVISDRRVRELRHFRAAGRAREDARWASNRSPFIRRQRSLLSPMELVNADVKVFDNIVIRADGSPKTPAYVAFLDCATQRLFGRFYLIGKGQGIRQEHVTETFLEMVQDDEWGFPERLYLDNGSEFAHFDMIRESMTSINSLSGRAIIFAKPYNSRAKEIESRFAWLQRYASSQIGGYIGGDLGRPMTHQKGKRARPYSGSFAEFAQEAYERIAVLEQRPFKSGEFKGRSPASIFTDWCERNWQPTMVEVAAIDAAFHKREVRRVYRGGVIKLGCNWTHPQLADLYGQEVIVAEPWRRGAPPLFKHPRFGWTALQELYAFHPLDGDGARASGRTQRADIRAVRDVRDEAGSIDLDQNHRDRVASLPTKPEQRRLRLLRVVASPDAQAMEAAKTEAAQREPQKLTREEEERRRLKVITEALERKYAART